jgi:hypothetical protein
MLLRSIEFNNSHLLSAIRQAQPVMVNLFDSFLKRGANVHSELRTI